MKVWYKHEAENALLNAGSLMAMIFRTKDHVGANQTAVQKAQLKYDELVQLVEELMLLDGVVLPENLASRIANKTFEARKFFMKPNA